MFELTLQIVSNATLSTSTGPSYSIPEYSVNKLDNIDKLDTNEKLNTLFDVQLNDSAGDVGDRQRLCWGKEQQKIEEKEGND